MRADLRRPQECILHMYGTKDGYCLKGCGYKFPEGYSPESQEIHDQTMQLNKEDVEHILKTLDLMQQASNEVRRVWDYEIDGKRECGTHWTEDTDHDEKQYKRHLKDYKELHKFFTDLLNKEPQKECNHIVVFRGSWLTDNSSGMGTYRCNRCPECGEKLNLKKDE